MVYGYQCGIYTSRKLGEACHKAVFVDGTKLESRAGRYTFVRRKRVEKYLDKLKEQMHKQIGLTSPAAVRACLDALAVGIDFVQGSGKRKSQEQKQWEYLSGLLERFHQARYEEVVADAGYESLDNYLYLDAAGQTCFIKPANHEQNKRKKFQKPILASADSSPAAAPISARSSSSWPWPLT